MDARAIRALRDPKPVLDPWQAPAYLQEVERRPGGRTEQSLTIFLRGAECPFTCVFCDLWRHTVSGPTPPGALPKQIRAVLESLPELEPQQTSIKLYNASNFFDERAVPPVDLAEIVELVGGFRRVVVEAHPKLVSETCTEFASSLAAQLEIAMGLETVHPEALPQLNKRLTLAEYDRAAEYLKSADIAHRSFVLIGAPFVSPGRGVDWVVISAGYAISRGAEIVSLIPVRGGNGALEHLAAAGAFQEPTGEEIEEALERVLVIEGESVAQVDTWDLERFFTCERCARRRIERLQAMSLDGRRRERVSCSGCRNGE